MLRSPVPASLHALAYQLKLCLANLRTPEHPLFTPRGRDGDAKDKRLVGRVVVTTPPFSEPFCMSVGAQS